MTRRLMRRPARTSHKRTCLRACLNDARRVARAVSPSVSARRLGLRVGLPRLDQQRDAPWLRQEERTRLVHRLPPSAAAGTQTARCDERLSAAQAWSFGPRFRIGRC
eukprot:6181569-Pleurochrysis_carterae.AAC.5